MLLKVVALLMALLMALRTSGPPTRPPLLLIISSFGFKSGWAVGSLHVESSAKWVPSPGDITVNLGYYNGSVTMKSQYVPDIDLEVEGAKGWGAAVILLCFLSLIAGCFIVYDHEKGAQDIDATIGRWVIRGGGLNILLFTTILYFCLAKSAHDEVQEKLESFQIKDQSLWPHPGLYLISAWASGFAMIAASFCFGASEIEERSYAYENI